jgi:hypothetical protein
MLTPLKVLDPLPVTLTWAIAIISIFICPRVYSMRLTACNVELRSRSRVMDSQLLNTEQVLSGSHTRRDLYAVALGHVPCSAGELGADFLDLEPRGASVRLACIRYLGHVAVKCQLLYPVRC